MVQTSEEHVNQLFSINFLFEHLHVLDRCTVDATLMSRGLYLLPIYALYLPPPPQKKVRGASAVIALIIYQDPPCKRPSIVRPIRQWASGPPPHSEGMSIAERGAGLGGGGL